jgi:tRNA (cytidine32/uridine32-2'-O)-methyltransferase
MSNDHPLVKIVLVETSHPGNIGSAARAMKTMGFTELVLVAPVNSPDAVATSMAAGADDVLFHAKTVMTLAEALADCHLVVGSTARPRGFSVPEYAPQEGIAKVVEGVQTGLKTALVFGRERTGLTNAEIDFCHHLIRIPSHAEYSSLNLSQAVQVLSYEYRMQWLATLPEQSLHQLTATATQQESAKAIERPATSAELDSLYAHWQQCFTESGFLQDDNHERLMRFIKVMMNRSHPSLQEVNILRGMLSSVCRYQAE